MKTSMFLTNVAAAFALTVLAGTAFADGHTAPTTPSSMPTMPANFGAKLNFDVSRMAGFANQLDGNGTMETESIRGSIFDVTSGLEFNSCGNTSCPDEKVVAFGFGTLGDSSLTATMFKGTGSLQYQSLEQVQHNFHLDFDGGSGDDYNDYNNYNSDY